jgi:hypothetical protein
MTTEPAPWTILFVALAIVGVTLLLVLPKITDNGLTTHEKTRVADYEYAFIVNVQSGGGYGRVLRGVDYVIALCRKKPDEKYDGRTMRQVVADAASTFDPYQPDLVRKLERGCP